MRKNLVPLLAVIVGLVVVLVSVAVMWRPAGAGLVGGLFVTGAGLLFIDL